MSEPTKRFLRVCRQTMSVGMEFLVVDLEAADTICECLRPADAEAIAEAMNAHADKIPKRLKMNFPSLKDLFK